MFSIEQIISITKGTVTGKVTGQLTDRISRVSTDSRTIMPGELFIPLKGERFDGHEFIASLVERQVKVCLCNRNWLKKAEPPEGITCIAVQDTLYALGDLAAAYRQRFNPLVIGVTGSNGKTSTKEMLAAVLGQKHKLLKTAGNLNNLIGLPEMLFRLQPEHQYAVLEMGMSEPGEIERLAELASPQIGIVLNALPAHLASMGTLEAVARAKGELLHRIADGGLAVVNADDPRIASLHQNQSAARISFGINRGEVRAEDIQSYGWEGQTFRLVSPLGSRDIRLKALGRHNIYNALAATAALLKLVSLDEIASGLELFRPYQGRFCSEQLMAGKALLIDDSYNANPASCAAALETVQQLKGNGRLLLALGDMLELGKDEAELHYQLGEQAAQVADCLYLVGKLVKHVADGAMQAGMPVEVIRLSNNHEEIARDMLENLTEGDLVLLKGSRGMQMEKIAALLRQSFGGKG